MEPQIKYVVVNPDGEICGPIGDTEDFCRTALVIGYQNFLLSMDGANFVTKSEIWHRVKQQGYTIRKAKIWIENNG